MSERRPPWWWRTEVLARMVAALTTALVAGYVARLVMTLAQAHSTFLSALLPFSS